MPSRIALPAKVNGGSGESPPEDWQAEILPEEPEGAGDAPQQTTAIVQQIPDGQWDKMEDAIKIFLDQELSQCESERSELINRFSRWKVAYEAPMATEPKNFPIHNASNMTVPLIKEIVNTLAAQLVQATMTARPYFIVKDLAAEWEPFVDDIEAFLDIAAERDLGIDEEAINWIIEACKLGTSVMEVGHEIDERRVYRYTADGKQLYPKSVIYKDGPVMNKIPLADFWIRFIAKDVQSARWCAKRLLYSEQELMEKQAIEKFYGIDRLKAFYTDKENEVTQTENELREMEPLMPEKIEVFEIFVSWDIDGDGRYEELRLYYHRDSRTFIGREHNPYWHGKRPFVKLGYFPREDRFYDEGLCEMLEVIQSGVSTKHNQRSDNATLANLKMIIKRKLMKGLQPGDPLYAGKIIDANDIWNDMREFTLSEIYPSTIQEEQILREYGERLSGVNDAINGSAMPVSRTTAAAQLALLQEQAKRIDLTVRSIRKGMGQIGWLTTNLYHQYGVNGKAIAWMGERGRVIEALFRLPRRVTELGLAIKLNSPTSLSNRQVKRENAIGMFNLLVQLYEKLLPVAQQMAPEQLPAVVAGMVKSAHHYMEDVLETFNVSDPSAVLEGIAVLERVLPKAEDLGGIQSFDRAAETDEIVNGISRLEGLLLEAERTRDGNARVRPSDEPPRRNASQERDVRGGELGFILGAEPNGSRR